jgi:ech hydrogenase subunit D
MRDEVISVSPDNLVGAVAKLKVEGYRFVTLSCMQGDVNTVVILYHFDKDLVLKHLRVRVPADGPLPSITAVYFAAFLVENEIQDLFGLRFSGLAVDYERTLYLDGGEVKVTPFCKYTVAKIQGDEAKSLPASADRHSTGGS